MIDPNIVLEQIQRDDVDAIWPHLEPDLTRACNAVLTSWTVDKIKAQAKTGELVLWAICDVRKPLPVLGVLTTCLKQIGSETAVSFMHLGGREMHRWLDQMVDEIETLGKQQGATIAEIEGRPGWARAMRGRGYRPARTILHKVI